MSTENLEVLVVDDNLDVQEITDTVLTDAGFMVILATSGDEALELVLNRGLEPQAILMNIVMEGKNGMETVSEIREGLLGADRRIPPIAFFTAWPVTDLERRFPNNLEMVDGVIQKPLEICQLPQIVTDLINRSGDFKK